MWKEFSNCQMATTSSNNECLLLGGEQFLRSGQIRNFFYSRHKTDLNHLVQNHQDRASFHREKKGLCEFVSIAKAWFHYELFIIKRRWRCQCPRSSKSISELRQNCNDFCMTNILVPTKSVFPSIIYRKRLTFVTLRIEICSGNKKQWTLKSMVHSLFGIMEQVER